MAVEASDAMAKQDDRAIALDSCIEKLQVSDRQLIKEVYRNGQSVGQVAAHLGNAAQTIYNRLGLLRKRLIKCVDRSIHAEAN
ncbi:MAG: helix-turn-helix domain-containing protein [Planctomycetota bacterium]